MPFSRRHTIRVIQISQKHLQQTIYNFFTFDHDLHMTSTFAIKHVLVEYMEDMMFYSIEPDLDPMTLILKLNLDMVKMCLLMKNEILNYSGSKVIT